MLRQGFVFLIIAFFCQSSLSQVTAEVAIDSINRMYVGTYTKKEGHVDGKAKGIYLVNQNPENGSLELITTAAHLINPSFIKVGKMGRYLLAVSELGPGDGNYGLIYSYEIKNDGSLREISKKQTGGLAPCHIAVDKSGKYVFVSNYLGGIVMVYKLATDGSLTETQKLTLNKPASANAHSVKLSGDNRLAYIADLGNDKIWIYKLNSYEGKLTPHEQVSVSLKEGSGPRHLSLGKNGRFAYVINELNSTISTFEILKNGGLKEIQNISSLPENYRQKNAAADIHIHPSGKILYVSNRGHDSIGVFKIDADTGKLTKTEIVPVAGKTPRNFTISPYGKYLYAASQDTGNITTFNIQPETGKLKIQPSVFEIKTPVCLEFVN
ncbi:lactonase family protein [Christiangramia salexigens]|uniref:6-phosphogluconolactonase n=1 Tax=Christiangramia salexigens TaxID=1913577 RepID=A0A1L3J2Y5_9FLAO|nr:lactonase family protein [Christiangramia salexigens]APG59489.1 6-phosphogluconolactonase [Christiangramia salexigens]